MVDGADKIGSTNDNLKGQGGKRTNTDRLKKLNSIDKNISIREIGNYFGIFLLVLCVLLFIYYLKDLIMKSFFNFKDIGSNFKQGSLYGFTRSGSDLGLKRNDYLDIDLVIRTDDASGDCDISGRYNKDGLEYIEADGTGDLCNSLNYEK
jgi:hypothetical protein